jgi:hypothetical protein
MSMQQQWTDLEERVARLEDLRFRQCAGLGPGFPAVMHNVGALSGSLRGVAPSARGVGERAP